MYRNIVYRINKDGKNWDGEIVLTHWDDDGNRVTSIYPHKSHCYVESPTGKYKSMFNTAVDRKTFSTSVARRNWIKEHCNDVRVFESLPPIREFLIERFGGTQEDTDFAKHDFKTCFFDIEVAIGDCNYKPDHIVKIRKRKKE